MKIDNNTAEAFYLDYVNNYLSVGNIALNHSMTIERANELIKQGRKVNQNKEVKEFIPIVEKPTSHQKELVIEQMKELHTKIMARLRMTPYEYTLFKYSTVYSMEEGAKQIISKNIQEL